MIINSFNKHEFKRNVFDFVGQIAKILYSTLDLSLDVDNGCVQRTYNSWATLPDFPLILNVD
jgi:hypothetical protein